MIIINNKQLLQSQDSGILRSLHSQIRTLLLVTLTIALHMSSTSVSLQILRRSLIAASALLFLQDAVAGIALLQPGKRIDATRPLQLTLLVSEDELPQKQYEIPRQLIVAASADMIPPQQIVLKRDDNGSNLVTLRKGEFRKYSYSAVLPQYLRGNVRLEPIGLDAAPILVAVVRPDPALGPLATTPFVADTLLASADSDTAPVTPSASVITPGTNAVANASAPAALDLINTARLTFNEPVYFAVGNSGGNRNAKFQLSFKYRLFQPDDPRSHGLIDNLYFGYTQFSLWDLQSPSAPFRDTNYRPSLYYFLPDLGIQHGIFSRMAVAAGLEHESNGRDGLQSRSINMAFVRPTFTFGNLNDYQLRISPKIYAYIGSREDNPDIAQYRGNVDLNIAIGKPDGIEFSSTLRKGSRSNYGSVDSQLSYPISKLVPGTAGFVMASVFYGYGESLLTYNQKLTPQFRIGYSLWR